MPVVDVAVRAIIEVDHIDRGDVAFQEGLVIVFDWRLFIDEDGSVAEFFGDAPD